MGRLVNAVTEGEWAGFVLIRSSWEDLNCKQCRGRLCTEVEGFDVEFKERNRAGSVHLVCSCEDIRGKLSWTELRGAAEGFAVAVKEGDLAELVLIGAVGKPSTL